MLIDAILDRKDDERMGYFRYSPKELYDYLMQWDLESYQAVSRAMDEGTNENVQQAMCDYIDLEWFGNKDIKSYIRSVSWI